MRQIMPCKLTAQEVVTTVRRFRNKESLLDNTMAIVEAEVRAGWKRHKRSARYAVIHKSVSGGARTRKEIKRVVFECLVSDITTERIGFNEEDLDQEELELGIEALGFVTQLDAQGKLATLLTKPEPLIATQLPAPTVPRHLTHSRSPVAYSALSAP